MHFLTRALRYGTDLDVTKPYGKQLAKQALAIGAGGQQLLRFGGGGNDALTYAFNGTRCPTPNSTSRRECLNQTWWENMLHFTAAAGAQMILGVSEPKWEVQPPAVWDSRNAEQLLRWTIDNNLDRILYGLELGNEVDGLYTGAEQAVNLQALYNLTVRLWPDASRRPVLLGPDVRVFLCHRFHLRWKSPSPC